MHDHIHSHHHDHTHDEHHHHGHNQTPAEHLHSHPHPQEAGEEQIALSEAFVDGFRNAQDKTSYLRLAGIPFTRKGSDGLSMYLVDVAINTNYQVGTASPAFASRELAYLPFPGSMVTNLETMSFTYVSLTMREDVPLLDLLKDKAQANA